MQKTSENLQDGGHTRVMNFNQQALAEYTDNQPLHSQVDEDTTNPMIVGEGVSRIEASELSGILRQIDNSCIYNTEKPLDGEHIQRNNDRYFSSDFGGDVRDDPDVPFGSVVYHNAHADEGNN